MIQLLWIIFGTDPGWTLMGVIDARYWTPSIYSFSHHVDFTSFFILNSLCISINVDGCFPLNPFPKRLWAQDSTKSRESSYSEEECEQFVKSCVCGHNWEG